ncbi:hypothetical protein EGW08_009486 [Elysia chlorotica]|uniref:Ciliary neurotrophic factor n=1 Tax=Elysia chlorotica TaxID=188477 RepID=A0A3S1HN44_ELYCH|nr:hypothetical protein EGW08_009486 [Elysia chlorotica]
MILSVCAALVVLSGLTTGAPQPPATIENPCRDISFFIQTFPPLDTQITATIETVRGANFSAIALIAALRGNGYLTADDIEMLNPDVTNLPGLPLTVHTDVLSVEKIVDFCRQAYHDISIHTVYVQEALSEQVAMDGRLLEDELGQLESKLLSLLCKIHTLLKSKGETITSFVDASVMPSAIKNIQDSTLRYMRNFILGKDTTIFLDNLETNFITLLNEAQA